MSSTTATSATAVERLTYWCHECDMSVTLISSQPPSPARSLLCPHCLTDFLEHMDSTVPSPPPPPPPPPPSNPDPDQHSDSVDLFPPTPTQDNYLVDSPYLQRLFQHLADTYDAHNIPTSHNSLPASKASIEALPTIKVTTPMLDLDSTLLCAVCKDQFDVDVEAKQLPCKHIYHSDCILPWLSNHNSCPVCRFQLPTEDVSNSKRWGRRRRMAMRFRELMTDEEDSLGFGSTLRHIARRQRILFPWRQVESSWLSPTQIGEVETESVDRTNSLETVSSLPSVVDLEGFGDGDGIVEMIHEDADMML